MKIFFIGAPLLIDGYRLAGIESVPVTTPDDMVNSVRSLMKREDAGILLLDYDFSSKVKDELDEIRIKSPTPVLVEVPGRHSSAEVDLKSTISKIMGVKM